MVAGVVVLCRQEIGFILEYMAKKKIKIGIIGLGYVGGAVLHWFKKQNKTCDLFLYDKYKKIGSLDEVNLADIIFVAVPTPFHEDGRGYDDSAVWESVKNVSDGKTIVLKSSVLPGSTDALQEHYPGKILLFNPEFLTAKTPKKDFLNPTRQIIGFTNVKNKSTAARILTLLPHSPYNKIMKAREAEMVKFFSNTFLATRVIFANQIFDLCAKLGGINYEVVRECVVSDARIGNGHFNVFADGYRGYGGLCLPKDTKALLSLAQELGVDLALLKKVEEINEKLRKGK